MQRSTPFTKTQTQDGVASVYFKTKSVNLPLRRFLGVSLKILFLSSPSVLLSFYYLLLKFANLVYQ